MRGEGRSGGLWGGAGKRAEGELGERRAIGSSAYETGTPAGIPAFAGDRPVALVTLGTVVDDLDLLRSAVRAVLGTGSRSA
ncbi:hypothetical protein [Pseudosporangium ferrugineum]|uniref:Uncharacterized protein n=1 Tax=Pseudosporangium ferrugineum TaxID=439699 RepID=A0A2T0SEG2_9ACTN|nr:hypothetical protein [Pseudosporangium ferrugineum]PRY31802.1 hypothetical protein CLV70_10213 [Pseudosporangium ferrugineum]